MKRVRVSTQVFDVLWEIQVGPSVIPGFMANLIFHSIPSCSSAFPIIQVVNRHCGKISIKLWKCSTRMSHLSAPQPWRKLFFLLRGLTSLPLESLNTGKWHVVWVTKIFLLLCVCFLDSFSCCKARALTKINCSKCVFRLRDILHKISRGQGKPMQWGNQKLFKLLELSLSQSLSSIRQDCQS